MKFNKPPIPIEDQLVLIKKRGMLIPDETKAKTFLENINYFRFSGYALIYEVFEKGKRTHKYKSGASFDDVICLYEFDSKLRGIVFAEIENIEIAFRSRFCMAMANKHKNAHWHLDGQLFKSGGRFNHEKFINDCNEDVKNSYEVFITDYLRKYSDPKSPPSWMMTEILSFGKWSKMYSSLKDRADKKMVSNYFDVSPPHMESLIHSLYIFRNYCAHHGRIWDRRYSILPFDDVNSVKSGLLRDRVGVFFVAIHHLLKPLKREKQFIKNIKSLLTNCPQADLNAMGLPERWLETLK